MVNGVVIGNVCSIGAMISDSVSTPRKKHGEMLAVQIVSRPFYSAGSILLGG